MPESAEPLEVGPELARVVEVLRAASDRPAEMVAPPEGLWSRIEAAVRADIAADATVVEYCIDRDDVVVAVGADWARFARENEGHELAVAPTGGVLWDAIGDESIRDLWRSVVAQVRSTGRPASVSFRCDGPNARRWFEMTLTPLDCGAVTFRSELAFEMPRPELEVLLRHLERDDDSEAVEICSWCGEGNDDGTWRPLEELLARTRLLEADPPPAVSYGICGRCAEQMSDQLLNVR